jgi:hypothetical protein
MTSVNIYYYYTTSISILPISRHLHHRNPRHETYSAAAAQSRRTLYTVIIVAYDVV